MVIDWVLYWNIFIWLSLWTSYNLELWVDGCSDWYWDYKEMAVLATSFKCSNCISHFVSDCNLCGYRIKSPRIHGTNGG